MSTFTSSCVAHALCAAAFTCVHAVACAQRFGGTKVKDMTANFEQGNAENNQNGQASSCSSDLPLPRRSGRTQPPA
jgi:hypothetical protein